jgi:hypothetical protein
MNLLERLRETPWHRFRTLAANHTGDQRARPGLDVNRVLADRESGERSAFARPKRIAHEILNRREHSRNQIGVRTFKSAP